MPGVGDLVGLALSSYFLLEAKRLGAPAELLTRMAANVAVDAGVGVVPLLGDVFDVFFKANRRNVALLREHITDLRSRHAKVVNPEKVWSFVVRNLVLIVAAFLLGLWSLFAWGVYALLGYAGGFAARNADLIPLPPELTFWVADLLSGAGGVVVWIVWLIGAGVIALVAFVGLAFTGRRGGQGPRGHGDRRYAPQRQVGLSDVRSVDDLVKGVLGRDPRR